MVQYLNNNDNGNDIDDGSESRSFGRCGILCVCPKTLVDEWNKTAQDVVGGEWVEDLRVSTYEKLPEEEDVLGLFETGDTDDDKMAKKKVKKKKEVSDSLKRADYDDEDWAEILRREVSKRSDLYLDVSKDSHSCLFVANVGSLQERMRQKKEREEKEEAEKIKRSVAKKRRKSQQQHIPVNKFFLICDEAHVIQNIDTKKTKRTLALSSSPNCVGVLLLTGTPMKNGKASNLFPLLRCIGHKLGNSQVSSERSECV